jgi:membrane associated rhomboid family serine protease
MEPPGRPVSPGGDAAESAERTSGLAFEVCYRHPNVATGVHCTRCGRPICPDCMHPAPVGYQCPECVKEARRVGPRGRVKLVLGRPGSLTTILLVANIAIFVIELATGAVTMSFGGSDAKLVDLGAMYGLYVAEHHQYWRLITVMFLHANLIHILFNMYALYLFGYLIENTLGTLRFAAIYFVGGFMASVASFLFVNPRVVGVGASGAIFALLGAWVAFNYRRRTTAMGEANLRGAIILIVLNLFLGFTIPNIDNSAHIGGLVAGVAAGFIAEGWGPRSVRRWTQIGGFLALVLIGLALTAYRVEALTG